MELVSFDKGKQYILVKWHGEDTCSIVEYKHISTPSAKDITVGTECQVMFNKKLHQAKVKAIGSKVEVEKKEAELLEELTAPGQKRSRTDTNPSQSQPPSKKSKKGMHAILPTLS